MSAQTLKRLAIALAVLVVVWAVAGLTRRAGRDAEGRLVLVRFDAASVDQVVIARPADTVRLEKQAAAWRVNGHPANAVMVDGLLRAVSDTGASSELVAESASSHKQLGLDSAGARRISVQQGGKTLTELLVGSRGSAYGSVYVRKPGENLAYQLAGSIGEAADRPLDEWRDKVIAKVEPDSVAVIGVRRGKLSYSLTRTDTGWVVGTVTADSTTVAGLLNRFSTIEASGFATAAQADSANFAAPDRSVRLLSKGGRPLIVLSMDSTTSGFWVRRDGDATTYRMESWTVDQLTPVDTTLRKK